MCKFTVFLVIFAIIIFSLLKPTPEPNNPILNVYEKLYVGMSKDDFRVVLDQYYPSRRPKILKIINVEGVLEKMDWTLRLLGSSKRLILREIDRFYPNNKPDAHDVYPMEVEVMCWHRKFKKAEVALSIVFQEKRLKSVLYRYQASDMPPATALFKEKRKWPRDVLIR